MIQVTRKEQQMLRTLKASLAAAQAENLTEEMMVTADPEKVTIDSLFDKGIIIYNPDTDDYSLSKELTQVVDEDPEVEQAWEDFRAVRGDGSMTKFYVPNREAEAAARSLEEVLVNKKRLVHLTDGEAHVWATTGKVQYWLAKGFKEAEPEAVPVSLQD